MENKSIKSILIFLYFILLGFLFFSILTSTTNAAFSNINLISPANNTWANTTPSFTFKAISNNSNFSCGLFINDTNCGNTSVQNDTITTINFTNNSNNNLSQGAYFWYINCTDADSTNLSEKRILNIDTTEPIIELISPVDNFETNSRDIDFNFNVSDNYDSEPYCYLYVDNDLKKSGNVSNNTQADWTVINLDRGSHEWYIKCEDNAKNIAKSQVFTFDILNAGYCINGEQGSYLSLILEEPNENDIFYVGDEITVKVQVENNYDSSIDTIIKTALYDISDDEKIVEENSEIEMEGNSVRTITLKLKIPTDINEDHNFVIKAKVYKYGDEDEQCKEESIDIDLKRKSHNIYINNLSLNPTTVSCGSSFFVNFDIKNVGSGDENVKLNIYSLPINFANFTKTFWLNKNEDYSTTINFKVPSIQKDDYKIYFDLYYDYYNNAYHNSKREVLTLIVSGNCPPPPMPDVSFSFLQLGDIFENENSTIKLLVANTGNVVTNYSIALSNYSWADLLSINPENFTLDPGKTKNVYIILRPKSETVGEKSFKISISLDGTTKTQDVNVSVRRESSPSSSWKKFIFELKRNWYWALLNLILAIAIIILIVYFVRENIKRKRNESIRKNKRKSKSNLRSSGSGSSGAGPIEINLNPQLFNNLSKKSEKSKREKGKVNKKFKTIRKSKIKVKADKSRRK